MPQISLTKGRVALVDSVDLDFLTQIGSWCFSNSGYACHYVSADEQGKRKTIFMHRLIMERMLGHTIPIGMQVDHVSGSVLGVEARLDNRRENLRLATRSENQANKSVAVNNTTKYKGITWGKGKFEARIKYRDKRLYLGRFDNAMTAALVYDAASRFFYREFAGVNLPEIVTPPLIENLLRRALTKHGL